MPTRAPSMKSINAVYQMGESIENIFSDSHSLIH